MNSTSLTIPYISERSRNIVFTIIAIGLGITLPRIFHLVGLGPIFLPMFLPIVILALVASPFYLLSAAIITPLLSTALFGMPELTTSCMMIVQLSIVGTTIGLLRSKNIHIWIAVPSAVLIERVLSLGTAYVIPAIHINPNAILQSYPGILVLSASALLVDKLYDNKK
ncbi:MAG: hypothetical protein ABSA44_14715 [Bacteroidota bacterium]|jgi:hypothetical protein